VIKPDAYEPGYDNKAIARSNLTLSHNTRTSPKR